jgi:hypothetical protein
MHGTNMKIIMYRFVFKELDGHRQYTGCKRRWEDNIKVDLKYIVIKV